MSNYNITICTSRKTKKKHFNSLAVVVSSIVFSGKILFLYLLWCHRINNQSAYLYHTNYTHIVRLINEAV